MPLLLGMILVIFLIQVADLERTTYRSSCPLQTEPGVYETNPHLWSLIKGYFIVRKIVTLVRAE